MPRHLDFFFFIGSTYTYLAVNRVEALAARAGLAINWRPFNVRAIMFEQNNRPFVGKPAKLQYMWRDVERRAKRHGMPFEAIPMYPIEGAELANHVAVVAAGEGWCPQYTKAAYKLWFLENKDPGSVQNLELLLAGLGKDPKDIIAKAKGSEVQHRFAAETDTARTLGIFGSPTFACESEIFWGDDRLEDAVEWCR